MATIKGFNSEFANSIKSYFNILKQDDKYNEIYYNILKYSTWGDSDFDYYPTSMSEYLEIRQNLLANGFKVEKIIDDPLVINISW